MGKQFHGQKTSMKENRMCFPSNDTETPPKLRSFFGGGFQEGREKRSAGKKSPKTRFLVSNVYSATAKVVLYLALFRHGRIQMSLPFLFVLD
ncbi:hypothetical protein CEXT_73181 [Caerostris extrusa]|uniref:Uncharacterized protein n=1 Tax=Caerostris extrusa TaxID=172846 RepID=A0AAV4XLB5_CAEEX|nr:hypothetical protein CEXT_73181 [Caerostris extrusa]